MLTTKKRKRRIGESRKGQSYGESEYWKSLGMCYLQQHLERVLHVSLESLQPGSGNGAINDTVVAGKSDFHNVANSEAVLLGLIGNNLLLSATDSKDTRLRGVDDGGEVLDAKHAKVGNAEGTTLVFVRSKFTITSTSSHVLDSVGDIRKTTRFSVGDNRSDQTSGGGDSNGDISIVVPAQNHP